MEVFDEPTKLKNPVADLEGLTSRIAALLASGIAQLQSTADGLTVRQEAHAAGLDEKGAGAVGAQRGDPDPRPKGPVDDPVRQILLGIPGVAEVPDTKDVALSAARVVSRLRDECAQFRARFTAVDAAAHTLAGVKGVGVGMQFADLAQAAAGMIGRLQDMERRTGDALARALGISGGFSVAYYVDIIAEDLPRLQAAYHRIDDRNRELTRALQALVDAHSAAVIAATEDDSDATLAVDEATTAARTVLKRPERAPGAEPQDDRHLLRRTRLILRGISGVRDAPGVVGFAENTAALVKDLRAELAQLRSKLLMAERPWPPEGERKAIATLAKALGIEEHPTVLMHSITGVADLAAAKLAAMGGAKDQLRAEVDVIRAWNWELTDALRAIMAATMAAHKVIGSSLETSGGQNVDKQ
jgi:cell division septum initiation protein DivIVA